MPSMLIVHQLVWDAWNIDHIARHQVTQGEVEEACHRSPIVLESYASRLLLIGPTVAQRVLEPLGSDVYYVVTASHKERQLYRARKGLLP